ncbi:MAG: leucine-rich repeat protein, partial [Oscillospiraceae bacterium]|nr:leucine-rich repeat protein [Candidatus Ruminococcus equi]
MSKTYKISWGDGTTENVGSLGHYTHTYRDGKTSHCVTVETDDVCATATVGTSGATILFRYDHQTSDVIVSSWFTHIGNDVIFTHPGTSEIPQGSIVYGTANNFEIVDFGDVTSIGGQFLMDVKGFSTLDFHTLPKNTPIDGGHFVQNTDIVEFSISDVILNNGDYTLANNTKLQKVRFGNTFTSAYGTKTLGNYFLYGCTSLKDINISDFKMVTRVGSYFANGWAVTELDLTTMGTLKTIGSNSFSNLTKCKNIYLPWTTPPTLGANSFQNIPSDCQIHVQCGSRELYETSNGWSAAAGHYVDDCDQYATISVNLVEGVASVDGTGTFRKGYDTKVLLTPDIDSGWRFVQWDDGVIDNPRYFTNIQEDVTLTPIMRNMSDVCQSEQKETDYRFVRLNVSRYVERGIINWGDGSVTTMEEERFDYTHEYADNSKHSIYIEGECGSIQEGVDMAIENNGTSFYAYATIGGTDTLIRRYDMPLDEVGVRSFTFEAPKYDGYDFSQWNNRDG